jgi:hypothetical protein
VGLELGRVLRHVAGQHMVAHHLFQPAEPEERELGEDATLVGDASGQHHIVGAQPVGGDDQQPVAQVVHVPDLTPTRGPEVRERCLEQRLAKLGHGL